MVEWPLQSEGVHMKKTSFFAAFILSSLLFTFPAFAAIEEGYKPGELVSTPWYGKTSETRRNADLNFIAGMRPHHKGALSMSVDYLEDGNSNNAQLKQLARGIIHNQKFEIGMLDMVEHYALQTSSAQEDVRQIAEWGIGQRQKFFRMPVPGPWDRIEGKETVTARDVLFAKAMIIHHQAALDMADIYLRNPDARNGYLKRMCLDIIVDQTQEIKFMQKIIAAYHGDPDTLVVDPSMVHGMEGMGHAHHQTAPAARKPAMAAHHHAGHEEPEAQPEQPGEENDGKWQDIFRKLKN